MQFLQAADTDYVHIVRKVVDNDHWATYVVAACSVDGKVEEGDLKAEAAAEDICPDCLEAN